MIGNGWATAIAMSVVLALGTGTAQCEPNGKPHVAVVLGDTAGVVPGAEQATVEAVTTDLAEAVRVALTAEGFAVADEEAGERGTRTVTVSITPKEGAEGLGAVGILDTQALTGAKTGFAVGRLKALLSNPTGNATYAEAWLSVSGAIPNGADAEAASLALRQLYRPAMVEAARQIAGALAKEHQLQNDPGEAGAGVVRGPR